MENLVFAREYLTQTIKQHDPSWLAHPRGPLGALWLREDTYAICHLISIASLLSFLSQRITQPSLEILQAKITELLNSKSERQFDETLTELQVANRLSEYVSPLEFEPLVPKGETKSKDKKPRSPDLGIRLPNGDVHLDATVFHLDALDQWDKSIQHVQNMIGNAVTKKGLLRSIELRFPLACKPSALDPKSLRNLVNQIVAKETGVVVFPAAGRTE